MHTPSRHRPLVLAYDSNPSSDGSVLASATPPARAPVTPHRCLPTPLRPQPRQVPSHALGQVQQLKEELGERGEALSGNKAWLRRRLHAAIVSESAGSAGE